MEQSAQASLRPSRRGEAGSVLNLERKVAAEASHTDDEAGITGLIERDPDALLVAELDGRLVASPDRAEGSSRAPQRLGPRRSRPSPPPRPL